MLGPVGVGKGFAASALGHVACPHGYHVRFIRADAMSQLLGKSRFDNARDAEMAGLTSVELLILETSRSSRCAPDALLLSSDRFKDHAPKPSSIPMLARPRARRR